MKEDLTHMREWVNDEEITRDLSDIFLYPNTLNDTESYLNNILEGKDSNRAHFVIAHKSDGSYIGQIDLIRVDWKNRTAEMGIVIGKKDCLGKGYGSEAIKLMQKFVFEKMNLNRLELCVHEHNERAKACYKKCGFVEEGIKRDCIYKDGKYTDVIFMGILKKEHEGLK